MSPISTMPRTATPGRIQLPTAIVWALLLALLAGLGLHFAAFDLANVLSVMLCAAIGGAILLHAGFELVAVVSSRAGRGL